MVYGIAAKDSCRGQETLVVGFGPEGPLPPVLKWELMLQ